jgi:hypothetical protein
MGYKRNKIIKAAKKLVNDKKLIIKYSNGEITKKELEKHGIKLSMPI